MKEFIISTADDGRKLEKWLIREMPTVGMGLRQKLFRQKCFKLNGKHVKGDAVLKKGDELKIYAPDELFEKPKKQDPFLSKIKPELNLIYEDEDIIIADKRPGLTAHPDANEKVNTLLTHVQAYLYRKGEYDSTDKRAFAPALCNRIDRFTGGIVLIAKTEIAMRIINQKIRDREIEKYYYCIAIGNFHKKCGVLDNYIVKKSDMKKVSVSARETSNGQRAQTKYRVLCYKNGLSLVECELLTGRTHQIRAQMAFAGHPLLGDNQYGDPHANEKYNRGYQALYAYKLKFAFRGEKTALDRLNGREFTVPRVRFVEEFFPEYEL